MILGFDVGNTHIVAATFDDSGNIIDEFRIPTNLSITEDILYIFYQTMIKDKKIDIHKIEKIIVSSVVPHLNEIFIYFGKKYFDIIPAFVSLDSVRDEITITPGPGKERSLGSDRVVDIIQAMALYPDKELIILDFGTAITFDVMKGSEYLGGCILPGVDLSIDSLFRGTAKLPKIRFERPNSALGNNTISQITAGIYYSYVGGIEKIIDEYKSVLDDPFVISTGGNGSVISKATKNIDIYISKLNLLGLYTFSKKFVKI